MSTWYENFEEGVILSLKGFKRSDLRFFRIDEYLRIAGRVDEFALSCSDCHAFRTEMEKHAPLLVKAVGEPGPERRKLDGLQSRMSDHMRERHGIYPAWYFTYRYSFYWTAALIALAFLAHLFYSNADIWLFFAPAFAIGVVTGQFTGGKKDRRIREAKKML